MLYLAAVLIVASVALFVAAPLGGGLLPHRRLGRERAEAERLEHELGLAMQALRELEFDRAMGKLSEGDYAALHERLMARALAALAALERLRAPSARPRLVRASAASASAPASVRFCPQCSVEVVPGKFCSECGAPFSVAARSAARGER